MKRKLLIMLSALIMVCLSAGAAFATSTPDYNVEIVVGEDNSYQVTEQVTMDFDTQKHGIYRYIPKKGFEGQRSPVFDQEWVKDWPYDVYIEDGNEVFQIGDADETVTGEQGFTFGYRMRIVNDKDTTKDFMYIDVLPTNWETDIDSAAVSVQMPKGIEADWIHVYSGPYGSEGLAENVRYRYDDALKTIYITGKNLAQGEGITVLCDLPEGYWVNQLNYDWTKTAIPVSAVVCAGLILLLWLIYGRDPKIIQTVEFYPPDGMTPAEIGFVLDGAGDKKDLISMIMYFAEKGYLSIEEYEKDKFCLHKLRDIEDKEEKKFARTLFDGLFSGSKVSFVADQNSGAKGQASVYLEELDEDFGDAYVAAADQLGNLFRGKKKRQFRTASVVCQVFGLIGCVLIPALTGAFLILYDENSLLAGILGIAEAVMLVVFVLLLAFLQRKFHAMKKGRAVTGIVILWILCGICDGVYGLMLGNALSSAPAGLVVCASMVLTQVCTVLMESRTKNSVQLMGKILGLREFIEKAELEKLNMLVEENPSYFYNILPYAYVMGLTDKWAKKFENIPIVQPGWYYGYGNGRYGYGNDPFFDAWMFSRMMDSCGRTISSNIHITIPDGGDGSGGLGGGFSSGGGGFSGGGFGGGGGGSW